HLRPTSLAFAVFSSSRDVHNQQLHSFPTRRSSDLTAVAIDTIINQKQYWGTPDAVVCVYVAVGQKESTVAGVVQTLKKAGDGGRSEEHTSELQSLAYLVCRLLLEKKNQAHTRT